MWLLHKQDSKIGIVKYCILDYAEMTQIRTFGKVGM